MKLSRLQELPTSREMIDVFGGYNHNLRIGEGEFYDMKNLTSSDYPVLSPRPKRGMYSEPNVDPATVPWQRVDDAQGLIAKDALCYVDGTDIVINGYRIDMGLSTDPNMCPKTLVSMGAYIIIMPDKMYINTANYGDKGKIESTYKDKPVTFTLCKIDGSAYQDTPALPEAPENPVDGQMYIDTSEKTHVLRQYSETNAEWISIATTYVRISFHDRGVPLPFNVGDGIKISGILGKHQYVDSNNTHYEDDRPDILALNNTTMVIKEKGTNYIVVTGIIDGVCYQSSDEVTITRTMPAMDFVIESGNRLWGCKYGFDNQGNVVNEIYASKLGDFKNWNVFDGISTDSYAATVGTDGFFTGAISHLGYPIFFKENCMHKVYGNFPANFQIQTNTCRGVQKGCNKSLAIVNEVLYYKSRNAVCAYDGSLPAEISSALGDMSYSDAVAGTRGNKYYVSMKDANDEYHLFVFDTKRGLWHREDNTQAVEFCTCRGELYYIDDQKCIKTINAVPNSSDPFEEGINWMAESGVIGVSLPDKKYISRLDVRMLLTVGTRVHFYIEYDSCGKWEHLFTMTGTKLQSFPISIRPRRCDHMRIRIEGDGEAKIFSICKTIEQGSDI